MVKGLDIANEVWERLTEDERNPLMATKTSTYRIVKAVLDILADADLIGLEEES